MDPERWNRIKELFEAAAELAPKDRAAYLARVCGNDAPLRSEVESLLASSDAAEDFLAEPAPIFDPGAIARWFSSDCIGCKVGPYRIVERIDEGGMGAVFLAERADGVFQSRVAIKFIRFGLESENAIGRFEIERQALARLDHPGVARLLDGGTTREGAPYLVMEYIDGDPIDVYCDQRCLSVRERLRLFLQVCDAVAAAHRQLIVHRDIKPGNILVTATGQVKLLDFGIAKLLSPEDVTTHHVTRPSQRFFTPLFASPEQLRGEPVTTASDVYSLGMLLYVLLAGVHPFAHEERTGPELEQALCEETPPKPSTAFRHVGDGSTTEDASLSEEEIAVQRGTRPAVLRRILAGDLDRIVMMAVRKEPHRRYLSVEQFAEDIERFLAGQPVTATRASWIYLAQKWVDRHRVAAVAGLALAVAISGGIAGTFWEAQRARRHEQVARQRFDDVRKLANAFLFEFDTSIRDLPGATKARHLVVERALEYLKRLQVEAEDDPGLRLEIATAYLRVGDVQGNPYYPNLGDPEGARQSYRQALELFVALKKAASFHKEAVTGEAFARRRLADILAATGDLAGALAEYRRAIAICKKLERDGREDERVRRERLGAQVALGELLAYNDDTASAERLLAQAQNELEQLIPSASETSPLWRDLALCLQKRGSVLATMGDPAEGLLLARRALEIVQRLASAQPLSLQARRDVAFAYWRVGRLAGATGRTEKAISDLESALQIVRALAQADPNNAQAQRDVTVILIGLGDVVWETAAYDQCRRYYVEALGIRQKLLESQPNHPQALRDVALCYERIADADAVLGRTSASIDGFQHALAVRRKLQQNDPNDWNVRRSIAYALTRLGEEHAKMAVAADSSDEQASEHCSAALRSLTECLELWNEIYRHSGTPPNEQAERATVERLIAELQRADFRRPETQSSASTSPNASRQN